MRWFHFNFYFEPCLFIKLVFEIKEASEFEPNDKSIFPFLNLESFLDSLLYFQLSYVMKLLNVLLRLKGDGRFYKFWVEQV